MKKIIMIAVMMLMCACMTAQPDGGGLFQRGQQPENTETRTRGGMPGMPGHGETGNQSAPISGIAFPLVFAAGYLALKNRKKENR